MYNLFSEDKTDILEKKQKSIKDIFLKLTNPHTDQHTDPHTDPHTDQHTDQRNFQNKVNLWKNLCTYQYFKHENDSISKKINHLFDLYKNYLDSNTETFLKKFPGQCSQSIFELEMVHLIAKKNKLLKYNGQKNQPDFIFQTGEAQLFLECTTRTTSFLDKFCNFLPYSEEFIKISEILMSSCKIQEISENNWYFDSNISSLWYALPANDKLNIKQHIKQHIKQQNHSDYSDQKYIEKIKEWIHYNRYACMYFQKILPDKIIKNLIKIKILTSPPSISNEFINIEDAAKFIVQKMSEKLKNSYFQNSNKGILAISLATLTAGINNISLKEITNYLCKNFSSILENIIENELTDLENIIENELTEFEKKEFKKKVFLGIENLYAIIIDTNWYNWSIYEHYPGNDYGVIYNDDIYHMDIFESLIQIKISFSKTLLKTRV